MKKENIQIRVSAEKKAIIKKTADKFDYTVSQYVMMAINNQLEKDVEK